MSRLFDVNPLIVIFLFIIIPIILCATDNLFDMSSFDTVLLLPHEPKYILKTDP